MCSRKEMVDRAIEFRRPERVPVVFWNRDQTEGDVMLYHLSLGQPGDGDPLVNAWDWSTNEWGYRLESLDDGTMGHPTVAFWQELPAAEEVSVPPLREEERMAAVAAFVAESGDRYRLASLDLSGFTVYTLLRGFENAMLDFVTAPDRFRARDGLDRGLRVPLDGNGRAARLSRNPLRRRLGHPERADALASVCGATCSNRATNGSLSWLTNWGCTCGITAAATSPRSCLISTRSAWMC